ncbi:hypothetical protein [Streptomyces rhizosphaericus]|uniref:hypothetical protein n=1 Tax=Streptomyces rhizosphaericus TaxID=114699 RepID=UPI001FCA075A|nr:hypothetical protein [Streptomyces rhizosphaericus]
MNGAGTRSDATAGALFAPYASRPHLRITTVYSTSWVCDPAQLPLDGHAPTDALAFGRLAPFYEMAREQLPRVLRKESLDCSSLTCQRWQSSAIAATLWHFLHPSGQVLVALTLDAPLSLVESIPLMEDLYYASIECGGVPLEQLAGERVGYHSEGVEGQAVGFLPERHQLVFRSVSSPEDAPDHDTIQRVIYRTDLPYRQEHSSILYPAELNRRPTTVGALGPYASLVCGHQDYIENCVLLSAVQTVGSAARLREIREVAHAYGHRFRARSDEERDTHRRRTMLESISDGLSHLELELSYSVETGGDIGTLVPALRVESFHNALYSAMGLTERSGTIGQMLSRLSNAIAAELTSVESAEQRAGDRRRIRTVVAVTFVTTVTGTLSLLFGFFGVNARQVDQNRSMFDDRYVPIYAIIALILACATAIFGGMRVHERWRERQERSRTHTWETIHGLLAREFGTILLDPVRMTASPRRTGVPGSRTPPPDEEPQPSGTPAR